ncbi:MAG: hypothetical protein V3W44_10320 [Dehalococcoidales bacterium]
MKSIVNPFTWLTFIMAAVKMFIKIFDDDAENGALKKNGFDT